MKITEPGLYDGITDEEYHGDPVPEGSLSSTGARRLLPPHCPAIFKHELDNGRANKTEFDEGHAAHKLVLGTGPELDVVDADSWRTNAAKAAKAAAYERGAVPLLPEQHDRVQAMANALRGHEWAGSLLSGDGHPEQSLFWQDEHTGVWRRVRLDWLPVKQQGRRRLITDYKTCDSADQESIARSVYRFGYHQQAAFYLDGVQALLDEDAAFLFVFQERRAPYLVTVAQLDHDALRIGRARNRRALNIYRECRESGVWPGYSNNVELISLPRWAEIRELEDIQ